MRPVTMRKFMDLDYLVRGGERGKDSKLDQVFDVAAPTSD